MLKNYQKKITKKIKENKKKKEKNKIKKNNSLPDDENKETSSKKITKKEIKIENNQPIVKRNICVEIKDCNIDEIAKYLLNSNKKRTIRIFQKN